VGAGGGGRWAGAAKFSAIAAVAAAVAAAAADGRDILRTVSIVYSLRAGPKVDLLA
jgi:hypothetical protein